MAENPALTRQEFNPAFVLMEYFGYLRRDPNSGQDTDFTGYKEIPYLLPRLLALLLGGGAMSPRNLDSTDLF